MHDIKAIRDDPGAFDRAWASRGLGAQTPELLVTDYHLGDGELGRYFCKLIYSLRFCKNTRKSHEASHSVGLRAGWKKRPKRRSMRLRG